MRNSNTFRELSSEKEKEILKIPEGLHEYRVTIRLLINHLLKTNMNALFLMESKGRSWIYTNELPEKALIKFIVDSFIDDPYLMNLVMTEYNTVMEIPEPEEGRIEVTPNQKLELELESNIIPEPEVVSEPTLKPEQKPDDYLTPKDVEKTYQISTKTLANWRSQGRGPEFFKFGNKVRYLRKNVEKWKEQSRRKIYNRKQ